MGIAATVVLIIGALFVLVAPVLWTVGPAGAVSRLVRLTRLLLPGCRPTVAAGFC